MPMPKKTLKALRGSIDKWEGIVAGTEVDHGQENCPLCELFYHKRCNGCPVSEKTGERRCAETPYEDYCESFPRSVAEMDAAHKELAFLKSLLPGKEKE